MPRTASRKDRARVLAVALDFPFPRRPSDADVDRVFAFAAEHPLPKIPEPSLAYVNWGRWVADCNLIDPATGIECKGAELVEPGEDMICGSCHQVSPVTWPSKAKRDKIEKLLDVRLLNNQNWNPEEDVAQLLGENIAAGLEK